MRTHVETTATGILAKRRRDEQSARSALGCRIFLGLKRVRKGTGDLHTHRVSARGTFAMRRSALPAFAARTTRPRHLAVGTARLPLRRDRSDRNEEHRPATARSDRQPQRPDLGHQPSDRNSGPARVPRGRPRRGLLCLAARRVERVGAGDRGFELGIGEHQQAASSR